MTGRAHCAERGVAFAAVERVDGRQARTCREPGRFPRGRVGARVAVEMTAAGCAEPFERIEIFGRVHPRELGPGGESGFEQPDRVGIGAVGEPVEDGTEPFRTFRVSATRFVGLVARVGRDQEHHATVRAHGELGARVATLAAVKAHRAQSYRFRGGSARVAAWHGRDDVASLALHGCESPSRSAVRRLLVRLHEAGYREVVTNALAPGVSLPLVDAGFVVRSRLHLLARELDPLPAPTRTTRRALRADRDTIFSVDAAAFDDFWRLDLTGLREAMHATPRSHVRVAPTVGDPYAYGLFGRANATGYVQRLAVAPDAQRAGIGRALLLDGLHWMRTHGVTRAFVNTQERNDRALALYMGAGFSRLPVGLCVLGREL